MTKVINGNKCAQCGTVSQTTTEVVVRHRRDGIRCEMVVVPARACGHCLHDLIDGGPYRCLCGRVVEIRLTTEGEN